MKKKGKRVLPASKDKNLAKILKENDKNWWWSQEPTRRERETWKSLNSDFEKVLFCFFLKTRYMSFDRSKISLDRSKQTKAPSLKNFKNFDRSKNRMDRSNQAEAYQIFQEKHNFWKTSWFNSRHWNSKTKMHEYEMIWFSKQEF